MPCSTSLHDPATLVVAFGRVAGNHGANTPGVDGLTVDCVEEAVGVPGFLDDLRAALKDGSFRPLPVRERKIPTPGGSGKLRKLGIPANPGRPPPGTSGARWPVAESVTGRGGAGIAGIQGPGCPFHDRGGSTALCAEKAPRSGTADKARPSDGFSIQLRPDEHSSGLPSGTPDKNAIASYAGFVTATPRRDTMLRWLTLLQEAPLSVTW
jgi:hypothetical protein